ncbi:hypothetical protein [Kordia sp.]|uniref:hypothetical protein n=1 Tax=Kordia sp. TaxID=1965332 RepID=UPI003D290883
MKSISKRQQGRSKSSSYFVTLEKLEDADNLSFLDKVTAQGTRVAHQKATETFDEIVYVIDGEVIRETKGEKREVIQVLKPRKVTRGATLTISRKAT